MQNIVKVISYFLLVACSSTVAAQGNRQQILPGGLLQYGRPFNKVPDRQDVTLYQVNIRTFSKAGDFKGVIERLDSIRALGVNVIYLMPHYPVGKVKSVNSPYCVRDYMAVNNEFGSLDDLRHLVEAAHNKNMAVLIDWVGNHTSYDHVWINNKTWYQQDSLGNIISPPGTGWNDVAQLNFKNEEMRLSMIAAMKYWVLAANIDGFRCDYSDGPPVDFWKQALDTLRNISSHQLLMLAEGTRNTNYSAGFDFNFGFRFFENLKKIYEDDKPVKSVDSLNILEYAGANAGQQVIRYITNHDVNGSDGTALELFDGEKGSMAAFVVVALMKSVPMIYNGQEVGHAARLTFPFTSTKINWTPKPAVTVGYKKVLAFRNSSAAIRRGKLTAYNTADVVAFSKQTGNEKVVVFANLRSRVIEYKIPAELQNSKWSNAMDGGRKVLNSKIILEPFSYLVLKNE